MGGIATTQPADERAAYMIEILGLDTQFLRDARAAALSALDDDILANATVEELELLQTAFLQGDARSYAHVLARFIEQYV
ncbi:hypothetical protein RM96_21180 [Cupriavidus sp. IDO]|nr:hypothetical protein RM96_21180 [Cupriavidus sp. IDO]